jgi:hypothetical membrane protein
VRTRWFALGGIAGPVVFVVAWVGAGSATAGYSPVTDPISDLAAAGAPHRMWMTAGFLGFSAGVALFAHALRSEFPAASAAAIVTAGATFAVALLPLDVSATVDRLHGVAAGIGYVSLAAIPLLARHILPREWRSAAGAAGVMALLALVASSFAVNIGLWQRVGLTVGDVWIVALATRQLIPRRLLVP